jgi:chromosomal replication initiation ATPase DnaA
MQTTGDFMSLAESFNHLQSRISDSPSLREIFDWVEWQSLREAVSAAAIDGMTFRPLAKRTIPEPRIETILSIQLRVSERLDVTRKQMCSNDRHHFVVLARHVAIYLCRKLTCASLHEIGQAFCSKDHSTVINAVKRMELMRSKDAKIDALLVELGSPPAPGGGK